MGTSSLYKNLTFTKGSSSTIPEKNALNSKPPQSMSMLARSINDEFSDYDDQEQEEQNDLEDSLKYSGENNSGEGVNREAPLSWLNTLAASNGSSSYTKKYGIGAELMKKMGYVEGTGLGSDKRGIVNPIETKLRPQGLGVGGIKEKIQDSDEAMSSSDEEKPDKLEPELDIFDLIEDLEMKGADVPMKYKELSDSVSKQTIRQGNQDLPSELANAYEKLNRINNELDSAIKAERFHGFQLKEIEARLNLQNDELIQMEQMVEVIETFNNEYISQSEEEQKIDCVSNMLKKLTSPPYSTFKGIRETFVAIVSPIVSELFQRYFEDAIDLNHLLINIMSDWAYMYREIEVIDLNQLGNWDSLIYSNIKQNLKSIIDDKTNTDTIHGQIMDYLQIWISAPVLINPTLAISNNLTNEVLLPFLNQKLEKWSPGKDSGIPPHNFIMDYISLLSLEESLMVGKTLIHTVSEKYLNFVMHGSGSSFWEEYLSTKQGKQYYEEIIVSELSVLFEVWIIIFDEILGGGVSTEIQNALKKSFCTFMSTHEDLSWLGSKLEFSKLELVFQLIFKFKQRQLIDTQQAVVLLQFKFFNPWIKTLVVWLQLIDYSSLQISQWYRMWYDWFCISAKEYDYDDSPIIRMVDWYFNTALYIIEDTVNNKPVTLPKLPSFENNSFPINKKINELMLSEDANEPNNIESSSVNVDGIPSYQLMTTFKDIVVSYCMLNNILFSTIKNKHHPELGLPLYKLESESGKKYSYIQDDVLWISTNLQDPDKINYQPISLDDLTKYF